MKVTTKKIFLLFLTLTIIAVIGFVYVLPNVLVKLSREVSGSTAADFGLRYDKMEVLSEDSLILQGDFIYPFYRNYNEPTSSHSLIVIHPLKYNTKWIYPMLKPLTTLDVNFISFDIRGHGRSEGHLFTLGVKEAKDISKVIDHVISIYPDHSFGVYARTNTGNIALKAMENDKRIQYGIIENYDLHPMETIEKMNYDDVFIKNKSIRNFILNKTIKNLDIDESECFIDVNKVSQPILLLQNIYNKENLDVLEDKLIHAEIYKMFFPENPALLFYKDEKDSYDVKECVSDFINTQALRSINKAQELYYVPADSIE